jgi:hypothetical protein
MGEKRPLTDDGKRFSVRASITLWLVLAGLFWVAVGALFNLASQWSNSALEAQVKSLSTIAPAAGPPAGGGQGDDTPPKR